MLGRVRCAGVHATLKKWYNISPDTAVSGSWADKFNFSRGNNVGPSLATWIRAKCAPAALTKLTPTARAVANICIANNWRPIGVETIVGLPRKKIATAIDLVVVPNVTHAKFSTFVATESSPRILIEMKVAARAKWGAKAGTIPATLCGEERGKDLTPYVYASLQLMLSHILYVNTFPRHVIDGIFVLHLFPLQGGAVVSCEVHQVPEWLAAHAPTDLRLKLSSTK